MLELDLQEMQDLWLKEKSLGNRVMIIYYDPVTNPFTKKWEVLAHSKFSLGEFWLIKDIEP